MDKTKQPGISFDQEIVPAYGLLTVLAFFYSRFSFSIFWGAFFVSFLCITCSAINPSLWALQ